MWYAIWKIGFVVGRERKEAIPSPLIQHIINQRQRILLTCNLKRIPNNLSIWKLGVDFICKTGVWFIGDGCAGVNTSCAVGCGSGKSLGGDVLEFWEKE